MNVTEHSQKSSKMGLLKVDVDGMSYFSLILSLFFSNQYHPWLENTEGAIISKTDILEILATLGTQNEDKTKTQHNMCWTPLYASKHKKHK